MNLLQNAYVPFSTYTSYTFSCQSSGIDGRYLYGDAFLEFSAPEGTTTPTGSYRIVNGDIMSLHLSDKVMGNT